MSNNEENHFFDENSPLLQGGDPVMSDMESRIQKLEAGQDSVEDIKDKRRQDWLDTNKWILGIVITVAGLVLFRLNSLDNRIEDFNREAREIRERLAVLAVIETRFNYEMEARDPARSKDEQPDTKVQNQH